MKKGKKDREMQRKTYLVRLCKCVAEQGLGEITNIFIKSCKGREDVENRNRLHPDGTRHIIS